ncbi:AAA family ATPase [Pelagicoccus sp. SDUM812005]|uniref:AAA family ATPase n=1 Tax=Pelagicoccus sp. SDUM812005 TaxID=3041257 RepID=UPI00280D5A52|nr:AAA family ATPase [Pelagicoccus sp. SDUM812005]MDQ8182212.1 AAA family ATPase [Pelagicoccus sp. SDUM812005]
MKLDYLKVDGFKNLSNFEVDFDAQSLITVVIGWNGTGKSNLFEALVLIFRDLDLKQVTPFSYKVVYHSRGARVTVENNPSGGTFAKSVSFKIEEETFELGAEPPAPKLINYLPSYVFGYYSGPSRRLSDHFFTHQRKYYEKIISDDASNVRELKALRKFFCAENHHAKYALIAFFAQHDQRVSDFLKKHLRIEGLESVLFVMKRPTWATGKKKDAHLWGAKGLVRRFLDRLFNLSLAPMHLDQRVPLSIKKSKTEQFLYLYLKDVNRLHELAEDYDSQSDFFAALESADLSEVIHDVQIKVRIRSYDGELTFRELSEGEQQLLMVLGLLRFTKEEESLILLDEPDTHLNPHWGTEYLDMLREIVGTEDNAKNTKGTRHIIMATHDPLVISGLEKEQIQILKRNEHTDQCYAETPHRSPKGMGFEGILTSEMFGFRSALDRPTQDLLDEKRQLVNELEQRDRKVHSDVLSQCSLDSLATETPRKTREQILRRIEKINTLIGDLDFTNVVRDEYFKIFSRAMADFEAKNAIKGNAVSPADFERRREFAARIIERIKNQE